MINAKRFARWALVVGLLVLGLGVLVLASLSFLKSIRERDEPSETAGSTAPPSSPHIVRLKPEALADAGIEVAPVARGEFRLHRDFPATVQPNENELAEVTTLISGRVVTVHADVGQDVKKDALLAMIHSMDLGVAEGAT